MKKLKKRRAFRQTLFCNRIYKFIIWHSVPECLPNRKEI